MTFLGAAPIRVSHFDRVPFWTKVDMSATDGCWPWLQSCGGHGYGQTWDGVTVRLAHRVAWTLTHGQIPEGQTVDHECRNPVCCNPGPGHLRLLPNIVNATFNGNCIKTHCPKGHEYTEENTRRNSKGHRFCRACQKISNDRRHLP